MTDVLFYHLQHKPLEAVLPTLLEKSLERGWRAVVQATSAERLAALGASATASHKAFLASAPSAARLANAAAGSAIGTPAWAAAQVALADLDSARSITAIALGDLDALMVGTAVQAQDVSAIEVVRQQVLAQVGEEDETLARLRAQVR